MKKKPELYPLKFIPILKEKVWGGTKLSRLFGKELAENTGESWEVSGVEGDISVVVNGTFKGVSLVSLLETYKEALVGKKVYKTFGATFPLLFKFIDADQDLSVQLHPNDALAKKRHNSFGKTEMWYVLDADDDARIILGFSEKMDAETYLRHLSENKITEILHSEKVQKGDSFFITPGVVHAIGAGVVIAEIQQTSDITYRIYDWNRPDINGELRELHNELAIDAITFEETNAKLTYTEVENEPLPLCTTPFFKTNKLTLTKNFTRNVVALDSFVVYMCVEGAATVVTKNTSEEIKKGETLLIPASTSEITIKTSSATILEVYIP
ncbi:type I phosphomannose isomerase catalytic subunit [Ulvibacter litoralis]|uniref:Phosphohexomutase n=1 Tax=Ulvibacter litoralis TaxID=227084 RepID=A0A1G7IWJ9_9FLAO|nr:type I phosphomannose isomerase catalytic subunit [Ulvibacter litoralis]GHC64895.1 mannose-6-phosphate isomerase [Ulvibacter litoralis]SDF17060.1 mannose-6-phosphate isomerase [Ulvibacter litoralis]